MESLTKLLRQSSSLICLYDLGLQTTVITEDWAFWLQNAQKHISMPSKTHTNTTTATQPLIKPKGNKERSCTYEREYERKSNVDGEKKNIQKVTDSG